jgi:hypothetical protein
VEKNLAFIICDYDLERVYDGDGVVRVGNKAIILENNFPLFVFYLEIQCFHGEFRRQLSLTWTITILLLLHFISIPQTPEEQLLFDFPLIFENNYF